MFFTRPLAQASRNSAFEMSPLPSLSTCVKLTMNGAAADLANKSPDGTALFHIASHCSGFRAAEGRPDVMVFAWASAQVAVIGSTIMEMKDALNISCLLLVFAKAHPTMPLSRAVHATKRAPAEADATHISEHRFSLSAFIQPAIVVVVVEPRAITAGAVADDAGGDP